VNGGRGTGAGEFSGGVQKPGGVGWAAVLVARPEGQLGNRIFQAAAFLAASRELGFPLLNPALGPYAEFFPALDRDFFCRPGGRFGLRAGRLFFCRAVDALTFRFGKRAWPRCGMAVLDIADSHDRMEEEYDLCGGGVRGLLEGNRLVVAKGWKFRARSALRSRRAEILELFAPAAGIQAEADRGAAAARGGCGVLLGLHVRRGDYAAWLGGKYFFGLEAYAGWMRAAAGLWPDRKVGFLVCSNEPVDPLLALPGIHAVPGPGSAAADLYALAACDFLIGPPSTFTLWASYYGGAPLQMLLENGQELWMGGFAHHEGF